MKPKLIIIFLLIVLIPLSLLVWLGVRLTNYERENIEKKYKELLLSQLSNIDNNIVKLIEKRERELLALTDNIAENEENFRETTENSPHINQMFMLDQTGEIIYPSPNALLSSDEWDFLERTKDILNNRELLYQNSSESVVQTKGKTRKTYGWYVWYWGKGIRILFWRNNGNIIGAELNSNRLLSDIIGILPDTDPFSQKILNGRITLSNTSGDVLYQWGNYEPGEKASPTVERSLSYPLKSWKLQYYLPPDYMSASTGNSIYISLVPGILGLALVLMGLAVYFYRENTREIREAEKRVNFVNQVSHELKTPLTNIRMYAELLENNLPDEDDKTKHQLNIIISESQRLSRLILNILSFNRNRKIVIHKSMGKVDEVIERVLDSFKESFQTKNIKVEYDKGASQEVWFDHDILEQIIGNLLNNVEKYASSGGLVKIKSRNKNDRTIINVTDNGPGIPANKREKIFAPFYRISNKLTDGVAGTGIGLSIARDLARLHEGDLVLLSTDSGASFELDILTPENRDGKTK